MMQGLGVLLIFISGFLAVIGAGGSFVSAFDTDHKVSWYGWGFAITCCIGIYAGIRDFILFLQVYNMNTMPFRSIFGALTLSALAAALFCLMAGIDSFWTNLIWMSSAAIVIAGTFLVLTTVIAGSGHASAVPVTSAQPTAATITAPTATT